MIHANALDIINSVYDKIYAINHANELFKDLSSTRKEKVMRALYLGDWAIRRMWEVEGCLNWEVLSYEYFKELEFQKLYDLDAVRKYTKYYIVVYNPWQLRWYCNCQFFSLNGDIEPCTHIHEIRIMNVLKEFIPYFIYAYRFLLPHRCYKQFMLDFGHKLVK